MADYSRQEELGELLGRYGLRTDNLKYDAETIAGNGLPRDFRVNDIRILRVHKDRFELVRDP